MTEEEFYASRVVQDSVCFRLIQISESIKQLSDEFKIKHETIPWMLISGLRNRVVHDYGGIDLSMIYATAKKNVPELLVDIQK